MHGYSVAMVPQQSMMPHIFRTTCSGHGTPMVLNMTMVPALWSWCLSVGVPWRHFRNIKILINFHKIDRKMLVTQGVLSDLKYYP